MNRRNLPCYAIPSVNELLGTKISDDSMNIDDGLSSQDDEDLFLVASMAFLQQQLLKRLGSPGSSSNEHGDARVYSDMLLFQTTSGDQRQRFYIRLKNSDKFNQIKNSETSIPESALSRIQLLPVAKKPKMKLSKIFRSKSKEVSRKSPKIGKSKRGAYTESINEGAKKSDNLEHVNHTKSSNNNQDSKSEAFNKGKENSQSDWMSSIQVKCKVNNPDCQLLNVLPNLSSVSLKKSISEKFRTKHTSESSNALEQIFTTDNENFSSYVESDVEAPKVRKQHRLKLRKQQSKLSVCMEDESESETEFSKKLSSKISYNNFPDEVKANLSPEVLQNIISQMIVYLEETPGDKD